MDAHVYLGESRVEETLAHPCDDVCPQMLWCSREGYVLEVRLGAAYIDHSENGTFARGFPACGACVDLLA